MKLAPTVLQVERLCLLVYTLILLNSGPKEGTGMYKEPGSDGSP